jgi:hypothetical protein
VLCGLYCKYCETKTFWTFTFGFCFHSLSPVFAVPRDFPETPFRPYGITSNSAFGFVICYFSSVLLFSSSSPAAVNPVSRFYQHPLDSFRFHQFSVCLSVLPRTRIFPLKNRFPLSLFQAMEDKSLLFVSCQLLYFQYIHRHLKKSSQSLRRFFKLRLLALLSVDFHPAKLLALPDL